MTEAGSHWLSDPDLNSHTNDGLDLGPAEGALYIFGSMDEAQATPALIKLAGQKGLPGRELALRLLTFQATPEALAALKQIDLTGLPTKAQELVRNINERPDGYILGSRADPKISRQEFLTA